MPMISQDGSSTDVLALANSPLLWLCALGVFVVIIVQSVIYMKAARKAADAAGITQEELTVSFRTGAIGAIGAERGGSAGEVRGARSVAIRPR